MLEAILIIVSIILLCEIVAATCVIVAFLKAKRMAKESEKQWKDIVNMWMKKEADDISRLH